MVIGPSGMGSQKMVVALTSCMPGSPRCSRMARNANDMSTPPEGSR